MRRFRHEPLQDRGLRTRQKLLAAARKVLVRRGLHAARVGEITKVARVGYGTFYKYFRNKQEVLEAVMEDVYIQLQDAGFPSQIEAAHLEDQIRTGISNYLRAYHRNREVFLVLQAAGILSPRMRRLLSEMREKDVQWMVREIKALCAQGWVIEGDPEIFSLALLESVDRVAQEWILRRPQLKVEDLAETLSWIWLRVFLPSRPAGTCAGS